MKIVNSSIIEEDGVANKTFTKILLRGTGWLTNKSIDMYPEEEMPENSENLVPYQR